MFSQCVLMWIEWRGWIMPRSSSSRSRCEPFGGVGYDANNINVRSQVRGESVSCPPRDELPSAMAALASNNSTDAMCLSRRRGMPRPYGLEEYNLRALVPGLLDGAGRDACLGRGREPVLSTVGPACLALM